MTHAIVLARGRVVASAPGGESETLERAYLDAADTLH